jgi:hypothetical protein
MVLHGNFYEQTRPNESKLYLQYTYQSEQYLQCMNESKRYCDMHTFKI